MCQEKYPYELSDIFIKNQMVNILTPDENPLTAFLFMDRRVERYGIER